MSMSIIQLLRRQGAPFPGAAEEGVLAQDEGGNMGGAPAGGLPAAPAVPDAETDQDIIQVAQGDGINPPGKRKKLARRAAMPAL